MLNIARVLKPWKEAASLNAQINLYGFWDATTFLTKSGDVGVVLRVGGVDYESFDSSEQEYAVKRLEAALKAFGPGFHVYQYLFKHNRPEIPFANYDDPGRRPPQLSSGGDFLRRSAISCTRSRSFTAFCSKVCDRRPASVPAWHGSSRIRRAAFPSFTRSSRTRAGRCCSPGRSKETVLCFTSECRPSCASLRTLSRWRSSIKAGSYSSSAAC